MSNRIPADGPAPVLSRVARKLRLRYSQAFVVQAVVAHPQPDTLLAVVDVARKMGLQSTPARAGEDGLSSLRLPAIVHFSGSNGDGGFGVLEAVSDDEVEVWGSLSGRSTWTREEFLSGWSGIVVLFDRTEKGAPERGYLRQRFLEVVAGGRRTPAVADGPSAVVLRVGFVLSAAVLLAAGLVKTSPPDRLAVALLVALVLFGCAAAIVMATSVGDQESAIARRVCRRGKIVDCHSVLTSRYSRVLGLPLSDIGVAFYGAILLVIASSGWSDPAEVWRVTTLAFTAALPFALIFVMLQISMRQLCILCMAVHVANGAGALVGWLFLWDQGSGESELHLLVLFGFYFALVLFIVIPYFRRSASLTLISDRHRRLAASPFASLAELLTTEPTSVDGPSTAVLVDGSAGEHEVVILVHPACGKCLPVLHGSLALGKRAPVKVFVGVAPKDPTEADRNACSVLVAAWMAIGPDRVTDGYSAAKKLLPRLADQDAGSILGRELGIEPEDVARGIPTARALVERAERAANEHSEGTPAVFIDSRPYSGPLAHLALLLEKHPELVKLR